MEKEVPLNIKTEVAKELSWDEEPSMSHLNGWITICQSLEEAAQLGGKLDEVNSFQKILKQ